MKARDLLNPRYLYEHREGILFYLRRGWRDLPRKLREPLTAAGILVTANERRLAALKDIHRGQRAFIIGNGPSLRVSDLDRLKGEISFACNKIYLAYDETDWRPTYYSVYDVLVAKSNREVIRRLEGRKVFGRYVEPYFRDTSDITYVEENGFPLWGARVKFSKNALRGTYTGSTTLYLQMQLAFYMGIREVYLLGLDFSFSVPKASHETTELREVVVVSSGEVNHFHPEYRMPGEKWTLPQLDEQYRAFRLAKDAFEQAGGAILNASRRTALDVFPLVSFDELFRATATGRHEGPSTS